MLSFVGTLLKNKPQLPTELSNITREPEKAQFLHTVKTWLFFPKKRKSVLLLSSMHPEVCNIEESTGDNFNSEIVTFYNITKAGVGTVDKTCTTYSVARKCWPLVVFFRILDIAVINSFVLYNANNNENIINRLTFL